MSLLPVLLKNLILTPHSLPSTLPTASYPEVNSCGLFSNRATTVIVSPQVLIHALAQKMWTQVPD